MSCACPKPVEQSNPNYRGNCLRCGKPIHGPWVVDDEVMEEFFDKLDLPPRVPDLDSFRRHCLGRELAGRPKFGFQYLSRDNDGDGMEEAADLANYACFGNSKMHRTYWDPEAATMRWEAAKLAARAHYLLKQARAAERGAVLWIRDEDVA